jgi:hypothetical protein
MGPSKNTLLEEKKTSRRDFWAAWRNERGCRGGKEGLKPLRVLLKKKGGIFEAWILRIFV